MIVFLDDMPVEIQVRTALQDEWAQFVERIGDSWGRGLRYGQASELRDEVIKVSTAGSSATRFDVVTKAFEVSDRIYQTECEYRDFMRRAAAGMRTVNVQIAERYFRREEQLLRDMILVLTTIVARQKGRMR